ncbi:MAG: hypothetical protein Q7S51_08785 [Gallionellaceae bacterium]|nr:hypothetical protein [Gallionellaceae bacterium]
MSDDQSPITQVLSRDIPQEYDTRAKLENYACDKADRAPSEFSQTAYLYFIARYLVVVYEVSFGQIPIQVWNEYRNAIDHHMRHITKRLSDTTDHVKKMEGHMQRAVLDISKIFGHDTMDMLNSNLEGLHKPSLIMIDNGTFLSNLENSFEDAKSAFINAKVLDVSLGDDAKHNSSIIGLYLDAVYSFTDIQRTIRNRRNDISDAKVRYDAMHKKSALEHIIEDLKAHIIWAGITAIVGIAAYFWK